MTSKLRAEAEESASEKMPNRVLLEKIVRRIVEVADPERIILFGSASRGEWGPDSDIDLLVVMSDVEHRRKLAQKIHLELFGVPAAVDILVVKAEDLEYYGDKVGTVIAPALREGREIYAA